MPRDEHDDYGYRVPGAYRKLLEQDCLEATRPDPRLYLDLSHDPVKHAHWEQLKATGRAAANQLLAERLEAGEPLVVPPWRIKGNPVKVPKDVPMFADRTITAYEVTADDVISPALRVHGKAGTAANCASGAPTRSRLTAPYRGRESWPHFGHTTS